MHCATVTSTLQIDAPKRTYGRKHTAEWVEETFDTLPPCNSVQIRFAPEMVATTSFVDETIQQFAKRVKRLELVGIKGIGRDVAVDAGQEFGETVVSNDRILIQFK